MPQLRLWVLPLVGLVLASPIIALILGLFWISFGWGALVIENRTGEPIVGGVLEAYNQYYRVPRIAPGGEHRLFYQISDEGAFKVVVRTASGRLICGGRGYVDAFRINNDRFGVTRDGFSLNRADPVASACANRRPDRELAAFAVGRPDGSADEAR